jgi:hypothetical protein
VVAGRGRQPGPRSGRRRAGPEHLPGADERPQLRRLHELGDPRGHLRSGLHRRGLWGRRLHRERLRALRRGRGRPPGGGHHPHGGRRRQLGGRLHRHRRAGADDERQRGRPPDPAGHLRHLRSSPWDSARASRPSAASTSSTSTRWPSVGGTSWTTRRCRPSWTAPRRWTRRPRSRCAERPRRYSAPRPQSSSTSSSTCWGCVPKSTFSVYSSATVPCSSSRKV